MKKGDQERFKEEIVQVLVPLFGEGVKNIVQNYYDQGDEEELLKLASHMLSEMFGEDSAHDLIEKIVKKYPKVAKEI